VAPVARSWLGDLHRDLVHRAVDTSRRTDALRNAMLASLKTTPIAPIKKEVWCERLANLIGLRIAAIPPRHLLPSSATASLRTA